MTENGQLSAEEPKGELLVYRSEEGKIKLEVRLENETVWLTQKMMAEPFQIGVNTVNYHIKEIYECGELDREASIRNFRKVRMEDRERKRDDFLRFNERHILPHAGRVSKQSAEDHARAEYEKLSARRRLYKEAIGEAETIKQLEKAAKLLPEKRKGRKK